MKNPKLEYIKANGVYYEPHASGEQDPDKIEGCHYHVCIIKKLLFGRWQIDYYDDDAQFYYKGFYRPGDEDKPNTRLILFPSGIEEIKYLLE